MRSYRLCSNLPLGGFETVGFMALGRAETGGPVVSMWCLMSCFVGASGVGILAAA